MPPFITDIRQKIANDEFEFSKHAVDQSILRRIIQCSYPTRPLIKIITLYEPDPQRWNDPFTQRKPSNHDN